MPSVVFKFVASDAEIHTSVGEKGERTIRLAGRAGVALFGPYVDMPAGPCIGRIRLHGPARGRVNLEITAESGQMVIAARTVDLEASPGEPITVHGVFPRRLGRCEVRMHCEDGVFAELESVELETGRLLPLINDPPQTWVLKEFPDRFRIWLDLGDSGVSRRCLVGDYEEIETRFMRSILRPGMAFTDIGANIGWYTLNAAQIVGPGGLVYSFEPLPHVHGFLARSVAENGFSNVRLFQHALAESPGILPIAYASSGENPGGTWLLTTPELQTGHDTGYSRFDVQVKRLDDILIPRCDVLKIDIEGAELLALKGGVKTLARHRPIIMTEINPGCLKEVSGASTEEYLRFVHDIGYEAHRLTAEGCGEVLEPDFAKAAPDLCNVVLLPRR